LLVGLSLPILEVKQVSGIFLPDGIEVKAPKAWFSHSFAFGKQLFEKCILL
jgi:hypothetical protein